MLFFHALYRLVKNGRARGKFRMLMQSKCYKKGHAEPLTFRAKVHALNQCQKTSVCSGGLET